MSKFRLKLLTSGVYKTVTCVSGEEVKVGCVPGQEEDLPWKTGIEDSGRQK